ncbi:hypothetical protein FPSE_09904 [Fusarium pseudograminearum CS3096]|uniref:Uncharacterized protein n=1 Tax=Fusarium pseudograminearum (strain CS3096) TaxID=1028729 RepID=K3UE91_FUSPC|nr:hypothetical protein FPSE_09904 [Fusarium pseudograminearum CS3096]EKJ69881.1 hypothetical protein FPSE_09904 [Fusarium pseudograminearum CS3096]
MIYQVAAAAAAAAAGIVFYVGLNQISRVKLGTDKIFFL